MSKFARLRDEQGLTLIELLVTVIILGILASITVLAVGSTQRNASVQACKADWASVDNAANAYVNDNPTGTLSGAQLDLYTQPAPTGSLADLGYMSQLGVQANYKILMTGPAAGVYSIKIYDSTGTTQVPATGATNTSADCNSIP